jgi:hypothetical protein
MGSACCGQQLETTLDRFDAIRGLRCHNASAACLEVQPGCATSAPRFGCTGKFLQAVRSLAKIACGKELIGVYEQPRDARGAQPPKLPAGSPQKSSSHGFGSSNYVSPGASQ